VNVPQSYSAKIVPNMEVHMRFAEHPGQVFKARLLNTAEAIDPVLQTLQTEFLVDNSDGELLPGGYTMVEMSIGTTKDAVLLPVNTLVFEENGLQVAVIDEHDRVELRNVSISTDFGRTVKIASGIKPGERLVLNPPDNLYMGEHVHVVPFDQKTSI